MRKGVLSETMQKEIDSTIYDNDAYRRKEMWSVTNSRRPVGVKMVQMEFVICVVMKLSGGNFWTAPQNIPHYKFCNTQRDTTCFAMKSEPRLSDGVSMFVLQHECLYASSKRESFFWTFRHWLDILRIGCNIAWNIPVSYLKLLTLHLPPGSPTGTTELIRISMLLFLMSGCSFHSIRWNSGTLYILAYFFRYFICTFPLILLHLPNLLILLFSCWSGTYKECICILRDG